MTQKSFKHDNGEHLLAQMDKTIEQKLAVCAAHMMLQDGATILDAGCANGRTAAYFALQNPNVHVIGVDYDAAYIEAAREEYGHIPNLEFIESDLRSLDLGGRKLDAILNLSILHEPYSYSGYRTKTVEEIIAAELENLKPGGVIINRDFMLPDEPEKMVYLVLSDQAHDAGGDPQKHNTYEALSDAAFFRLYARQANAYDGGNPEGHIKGFFYEEVTEALKANLDLRDGQRAFMVPHHFAWEFTWRNKYRARFENETEEKYAFWTHGQHRSIPQTLGARVVYSAPYENPWLLENWYAPHVQIFDESLKPLPLPPSNFISVLQRTQEDAPALYREHSQSDTPPQYLRMSSFENTSNGSLYDMVERPGGDVIDVFPYAYDAKGELNVLAKECYPRPLANVNARMMASNLDDKRWSAHMIEPITAANIEKSGGEKAALEALLTQRVGLPSHIINYENVVSQHYYPAPSEVNERVHALGVSLSEMPNEPMELQGQFSGFKHQGCVRSFNAQSLLQASQSGMLPEARLETGIYNLMRDQNIAPGHWLGAEFNLNSVPWLKAISLSALRAAARGFKAYETTDQRAEWLEIKRSVFHEIGFRDGRENRVSEQELEFIHPMGKNSLNVAVVVPLIRDAQSGEVLIGVQKLSNVQSQFASVQQREGYSGMLSLPLLRLPTTIKHVQDVPSYIQQELGVKKGQSHRLGEGYFPSLGIMPARVFPYAVTEVTPELIQKCDFVPLREAFENIQDFEHLHLINAIYRSVHALGLWLDYQPPKTLLKHHPRSC